MAKRTAWEQEIVEAKGWLDAMRRHPLSPENIEIVNVMAASLRRAIRRERKEHHHAD